LRKKKFALQNGEKNTEVLPFLNLTNTPRAIGSMVNSTGHVAVLTILFIEK
jgi:hypothetical protein